MVAAALKNQQGHLPGKRMGLERQSDAAAACIRTSLGGGGLGQQQSSAVPAVLTPDQAPEAVSPSRKTSSRSRCYRPSLSPKPRLQQQRGQ